MQSKSTTYVLIIVIAIAIIAFFYWQTLPKQKPVSDVIVVSSDVFDSDVIQTIMKRGTRGNVPVTVPGAEMGKPDPFSGL
jgi:hypothetical protein